jgi:hypothetical protein
MAADMTPNFQERMVSRRSVECPVVYTDGVFCATGIAENLTVIGIRVKGTQPVRIHMKLIVFVLPPGEATRLLIRRGTVRWIKGTAFGLDLAEVSPSSHAELSRLAALHLPTLWANLN